MPGSTRPADHANSGGQQPQSLGADDNRSDAGLSNDYLNHYNEVLMLIEMAPDDPSISGALALWWPVSYLEYFKTSQLARASHARDAYLALPEKDRQRFERLIAVMETLAMMAVFALQPPSEPKRASVVVDATAPVLRRLIASASAFLNSAGRNASPEVVDEAEAVINAIIDAKPLTRAPETLTAPEHRFSPADIVILVVEDDAILRELYRNALDREGYQVLTADTGEAALSILREWGQRVDWLFTDVRLTGLIDGWVVGSEFGLNHRLRPIIYGSGYEPDASRQIANSVFMRKPINVGELVATFRRLNSEYLGGTERAQ